MTLRTKALPTGIGLEVLDLDIGESDSRQFARQLRAIWMEAGVLLFRGVGTSPEALLKLSRCFGQLEPHPIESFRAPGYPELILLTNENGLQGPVYEFDGVPTYGRIPWHTDLAFRTIPNSGALLRMVKKVPVGGQTAWLDTALAYDMLDDDLKRRIEGVEARFEFCANLDNMRFLKADGVRVGQTSATFPDYPPIARPLVWAHPETGRKVLNLCPLNLRSIVGMDESGGDALIKELIDAVVQPRFVYEHEWSEDDIILWDNYRMMHRAAGHPVNLVRVVQRTTLRGNASVGRVLGSGEKAQAA